MSQKTALTHVFANRLLVLVASFSLVVLAISFYVEFRLSIESCNLCKLQRIPYMLVVLSALIGIFTQAKRLFAGLVTLFASLGMGLAIYHLNIQLGFVADPCIVNIPIDLENFKQIIFSPSLLCSKISWSLLEIPASGWNVFVSLSCFLISLKILKTKDAI